MRIIDHGNPNIARWTMKDESALALGGIFGPLKIHLLIAFFTEKFHFSPFSDSVLLGSTPAISYAARMIFQICSSVNSSFHAGIAESQGLASAGRPGAPSFIRQKEYASTTVAIVPMSVKSAGFNRYPLAMGPLPSALVP